jgi:hypothetical protein
LQKSERADNIRFDEFFWTVNRTIYVTLGGEMNDRPGFVLEQERVNKLEVIDAAGNEFMARITHDTREILQIAGVSQPIQIDECAGFMLEPFQNEIGTDEACSAGY